LCGIGLGCAALASVSVAEAHGVWAHIHVTGWAIDNQPDEELRDFFSDPEVLNAALYGAAFTDSGYWPQAGELSRRSRAYSEHTHWEPFVQDFVAWIIAHDPPPWTSVESKKRVAFLLGCASHGLQDELFDSVFLYQVRTHDGKDQEEADPGTDGFFAKDRWITRIPTEYIPMDTVLELYAGLGQGVDEATIRQSVDLLNFIYLGNPEAAAALGTRYESIIPWTREHYLDPAIPGSIASEVFPTMRYQQAIWRRLHGQLPVDAPVVVSAFPDAPRRLHGADSTAPDSWATLIFAEGVRYSTTAPTWQDDQGEPVPFDRANTRWGATWPRLIRLQPTAPLVPGAWTTVSLPAGAERIDGQLTTTPFSLRFQVPCDDATASDCADLGALPTPDLGEPAPEPEMDAGLDAEPDASTPDADPTPDAALDAEPDAPPLDTGLAVDVAADGASNGHIPPTADASDDGGCACGVTPRRVAPSGAAWALLALVAAVWTRARRGP